VTVDNDGTSYPIIFGDDLRGVEITKEYVNEVIHYCTLIRTTPTETERWEVQSDGVDKLVRSPNRHVMGYQSSIDRLLSKLRAGGNLLDGGTIDVRDAPGYIPPYAVDADRQGIDLAAVKKALPPPRVFSKDLEALLAWAATATHPNGEVVIESATVAKLRDARRPKPTSYILDTLERDLAKKYRLLVHGIDDDEIESGSQTEEIDSSTRLDYADVRALFPGQPWGSSTREAEGISEEQTRELHHGLTGSEAE